MSSNDAADSDQQTEPHPPAERPSEKLSPRWRRFVATALTWYVIVAIFGAGYLVARLAHASESTAVIVGALAAGPLALAFVWERLTGLRLFGVELSLSQVIVPVDRTLATALSEHQWLSGNKAIFELVDRAIENPNLELLEINLRARMKGEKGITDYWWSTRLYLQAALVDDRTRIERLVFVEGDAQRRYVGMASPAVVRRALAQSCGLNLDRAYCEIEEEVRHMAGPSGYSEARQIVEAWAAHTFTKDGKAVTEEEAQTPVSAELLTQWVAMERESVEWNHPLDSILSQALVLEKGTRFVPLTQGGRLQRVVNADAFARHTATEMLRTKLG
jgi:hypothetical protein